MERVTNLPSAKIKGEAHLAIMGSSSDGSARMSRMSSGRSYAPIGSLVKMDDWSVIVWARTDRECSPMSPARADIPSHGSM